MTIKEIPGLVTYADGASSTNLFNAFLRQIQHMDGEGFTDKKLQTIAKAFQLRVPLAAIEISRFVLLNFPLNATFQLQSPALLKQIAEMKKLYEQVANAMLTGKPLEALPQMKWLFNQFNPREATQRTLMKRVKNEALSVHEYICTFSHWLGVEVDPIPRMPQKLYGAFHVAPNGDVDLGRFFYKRIAIFAENQWLTWEKHIVRWATNGGMCLGPLVGRLEGSHLVASQPICPGRGQQTTLKKYTHEQTVAEFEKLLDTTLDAALRAELMEDIEADEELRLNIVYFTGNAQELKGKVLPQKRGYPWMIGAQRYMTLLGYWNIPDLKAPELFRWCREAPSDVEIVAPEGAKRSILAYLGYVQNLMRTFLAEDSREKSGLALLMTVQNWDPIRMGAAVEQICLMHDWEYAAPVQLDELIRFLIADGIKKNRADASQRLQGFLTRIEAEGNSPWYFAFLYEAWDQDDLNEARNHCIGREPVEKALILVQNTAVKRRIEILTAAPLPQGLCEALITSSDKKPGLIKALSILVENRGRQIDRWSDGLDELSAVGLDRALIEHIKEEVLHHVPGLLKGAGFIPYLGERDRDRIAWSYWTWEGAKWHLEFSFLRRSDWTYVKGRVTYHGPFIGLRTNGSFKDYLERRVLGVDGIDPTFEELEPYVENFVETFKRIQQDAVTQFGKAPDKPLSWVQPTGLRPAYIDGPEGIRCTYKGNDPIEVTMESGGRSRVVTFPRSLFSHDALKWQVDLLKNLK